jgi:alkylation response protein AidB-like acyl-CoA dehydrogenase
MAFFQEPPRLGNQFDDDPMLGDLLCRILPPEIAEAITPELRDVGDLSANLYPVQRADRLNEPVHTPWDAWGNRIDHIEVSPLWKLAQPIAAERGMVAAGYEPRFAEHARMHQFAIVHVLAPSLDTYSCPLAMTDGAARTLLEAGNPALIERAVPRLTTRDPARMWTSGQWMTERTGGSDVGLSETVAKKDGDTWRLHGTKWFTSATTAEMALTLGRPEGNPDGSRGLALFFVQVRDDNGRMRGITVNRLKDKLGTRKVPTAELTLDGAPAELVKGDTDGVRHITPMLAITRTWNAVCAVSGMRRGLALVRDYARRRRQFGALLVDKPLHADTIAGMEAEYAGAFLLAFRAVAILGRREHGRAGESEELLSRALTPIVKLTTGKQAVALASEALECCGGAGYVEDTGLPTLLRDSQVLPIWEGTTNVLSLDTLRALAKGGTLEAVAADARAHLAEASDPSLTEPVDVATRGLASAIGWAQGALADPVRMEAGARRFAMTLGRVLEQSYLVAHAQWCLDNGRGPRAAAAARRFARTGVDLISEISYDDTRLLV